MRKPFFRKQTKSWYCWIDDKQVNLGKDKEAAFAEYHKRMAGQEPPETDSPVQDILGKFLDWCQRHREPRTYEWYRDHIQCFSKHIGRRLKLKALKPHHVTEWIDKAYPGLSDNYRSNAVRAVMRAFNWAVKQGHIEKNPVKGVERPAYQPREVYITADQWAQVMEATRDPFQTFLVFLKETGCRPQEARAIESRHFDRDLRQIVFPVKESKGKKRKRVIPLNDAALAIIQKLTLKYPEGPIFRNSHGKPWTAYAVNCQTARLTRNLGFKLFAYAIRHTFITDALLRGVDPLTLAIIVGHKDATMIMRVYSHLNLHQDHIQKALKQATGEVA